MPLGPRPSMVGAGLPRETVLGNRLAAARRPAGPHHARGTRRGRGTGAHQVRHRGLASSVALTAYLASFRSGQDRLGGTLYRCISQSDQRTRAWQAPHHRRYRVASQSILRDGATFLAEATDRARHSSHDMHYSQKNRTMHHTRN